MFARLAVHEIIARPELLTEAGLQELFNANHRWLFATAVTRLSQNRIIYDVLLRALAYSRGRGLPMRDGVWTAMASALDGGQEVTDTDAGLLLGAAAPYVMLDREHGQTVYRLAHRTFAEHFTAEADASGEVPLDDQRRHHAIALRLIADAEADPAAELNPYLAHYLSAHIGAAGEQAWRHLADRPGLLDRLDPNAVGADAWRTAFGRFPLPPEITGVLGARHVLAEAMPSDRPGLRQLAMARYAGIGCPGIDVGPNVADWLVLWASVVRQPTQLTRMDHTGEVWAIAVVPDVGGRTVLATGSGDGTVRLWDPATGSPRGEALTAHTSAVLAVAAVPGVDGRTVLATGSDDGTVRLWDPVTGTSLGEALTGHTSAVFAVAAVPDVDGCTLLATGSSDETVRLWDPATSSPRGKALTGHTGGVFAVAAVPDVGGRTLLATGGGDGTVRLWDPATGIPSGEALTGRTSAVFAVAAVPGVGGRTVLATGSRDGKVRLWDPVTGTSLGEALTGHTDWVRAVAAVPGVGGRTVLATGGGDGTVWLWDPVTGTRSDKALTGHTDWVFAVAAVPGVGGRTLLATGSRDGTVRLWDPVTGTPVSMLHVRVDLLALCPLPAGRLAAGTNEGIIVFVVKALVSG